MEPTLEEVRRELAEIYEQLLDLPKDDYERRAELRSRQHELRQKSHELADGIATHDAETLKAAFSRLADVRDRVLDQHLAYDSTAAGVGGIEGSFLSLVNKAIDDGMGLDEIENRMQEILKELRTLE